jgi:hypothetical protein
MRHARVARVKNTSIVTAPFNAGSLFGCILMIKYQLICDQKHEFEGWFQTGAAFDDQAANGLVSCPVCNSMQVKRALMTPNLASPKRRKTPDAVRPPAGDAKLAAPPPAAPSPQQMQAFGAALAELRQLQQKIKADCRDVGTDFAEAARKIHYGEVEAEGIYGQTTAEEREALEDEGIDVFDMPWLPPDH